MKKIPQLITYRTLRKGIGMLGLFLPIVLVLGSILFGGCREIQSSISAYYHTNMRDVLVGVLCAVALFLFAYKGYEKQDNIISNLGAVFALGVAFFPTSINADLSTCITETINTGYTSTIHFICAGLFLFVLAYFSLALFTKGYGVPSSRKKLRNIIYRTCGSTILFCLILIILGFLLRKEHAWISEYKATFWLESIALWAFGISWLIKGNAIFKDLDLQE